MIELKYSLIIEATDDPNFFGFYSPELEGFTGIGHSIEDCIYKANHHGWLVRDHPPPSMKIISSRTCVPVIFKIKLGMIEHMELLKEQGLPIPKPDPNIKIVIQNQMQSDEML